MGKRKYQLPHFEAANPMDRAAVRVGHIWTQKYPIGKDGQYTEKAKADMREQTKTEAWAMLFWRGFIMHTPEGLKIDPVKVPPDRVWQLATMHHRFIYGVKHQDEYAVHEKAAMHNYAHYGQQVFSLSPLMQEMFINTDLGKTKLEDLKMPYGCFYVSLENSDWFDGFYVNHMKAPEEEKDVDDCLNFVGVKFAGPPTKWKDDEWLKAMDDHDFVKTQSDYHRYFFSLRINDETRSRSLQELIDGTHKQLKRTKHEMGYDKNGNLNYKDRLEYRDSTIWGELDNELDDLRWTIRDPNRQVEGIELHTWSSEIPGVGKAGEGLEGSKHLGSDEACYALSDAMVRVAFSLMFYLQSEKPSVEIEDFHTELQQAKKHARSRSKQAKKKERKEEAKENLKYMSRATFHRVGIREERNITRGAGFSMDQPRHWRIGHMAMRWTGKKKENGVAIPYEEWAEKRTSIVRWILPTLIHPEKEYVDGTNRTVVTKEDEDAWMDDLIEPKVEGTQRETVQTKTERDPRNRRLCIEAHGPHCFICGDDGRWLDDDGLRLNKKGLPAGWLHCHHIEPFEEKAGPRKTDPVEDMIPLCTGCHSMFHVRKPALSREEAVALYRKREKRKSEIRMKRASN